MVKDVITDPENFIGKCVHVEGWNYACVFELEKINGATYHLITPKTRKRYTTKNNLVYTNKNNPNKIEILG